MTRFDRYLGTKIIPFLGKCKWHRKSPLHITPMAQESLQPHLLFQWPSLLVSIFSHSFLACYPIWPQFPGRNSCNYVASDLPVSEVSTSFGQRLRWDGFHISLRACVQHTEVNAALAHHTDDDRFCAAGSPLPSFRAGHGWSSRKG